MAKGEDSIRRKKNKIIRKRIGKKSNVSFFSKNQDSKVSLRIASIIATKKRRKAGTRRICEGMCFSLPTPEDPFNDRYEMKFQNRKKQQHLVTRQIDPGISLTKKGQRVSKAKKAANCKNGQGKFLPSTDLANKGRDILGDPEKSDISLLGMGEGVHTREGLHRNSDGLPKFLILCLNAIQNSWLLDDSLDRNSEKPLLANSWGVEFWRCCSGGSDILETSRACSSTEKISWLVSTAADIVTRKEREGLAIASPFLLFLVPSQVEAVKVRSLCKPLKALGIHTVSLHAGASVDHQVHGLRSCEPEFLVSTPERLSELVLLGAIDISGVSFLVVDGLENFVHGGLVDKLNFIRQRVSGDPQIVIFSDFYGNLSTSVARNLLRSPIRRLSCGDSIVSQSACISQCVHMYTSDEEKMSKAVEILNQACSIQLQASLLQVLFVVGTTSEAQMLITSVQVEGCCLSNDTLPNQAQGKTSGRATNSRGKRVAVSVMDEEHVRKRADIGEFEIVILFDFPLTIDGYTGILTKMARNSVNGVLHCFFHGSDNAPLAGPLTKVLEKCSQPVPETLRILSDSATSMLEC